MSHYNRVFFGFLKFVLVMLMHINRMDVEHDLLSALANISKKRTELINE